MKTLKTINDVYIRSKKPEKNKDNLKGIIYKGFEVTVKDKEIQGKPGEDNNPNTKWYEDLNGDYLWSGGFEGVEVEKYIHKFINYNSVFKDIPENWKASGGKDINIAVLDSGIYENHPDFEGMFFRTEYESKNFTDDNSGYLDKNGHGTNVAGLIGARSSNSIGVVGVAPKCNIFNLKVLDDAANSYWVWLDNAFDFILESEIDFSIINLSLSITYYDYQKIEDKLKKIHEKGIYIIAAAGNNEGLLRNEILYPAESPFCIAVGSVNRDFNMKNNKFPKSLDYIIPASDIYSCSIRKNKYYTYKNGSSFSTSLFSGILALSISTFGKLPYADLLSKINSISTKYNDSVNKSIIKIYKP
ncbi:MAG: S8/S53 family peptidase [Bacteroidales bacterium]|nr:S8/S53 family peptidase [Bacteroidales bacterium]